MTKPLFAMAPDIAILLTARLLARVKGRGGAPRVTLWQPSSPAAPRGAAFGLRQSGYRRRVHRPLAGVDDVLSGQRLRAVFWVAVVPGMMAVHSTFRDSGAASRQGTQRVNRSAGQFLRV